MGSCTAGDSRYMKGRLFCTQWFDQALTEEQMNKAKALCVPASEWANRLFSIEPSEWAEVKRLSKLLFLVLTVGVV